MPTQKHLAHANKALLAQGTGMGTQAPAIPLQPRSSWGSRYLGAKWRLVVLSVPVCLLPKAVLPAWT